ncbi:MAG: hypothetical protein QOG91_36 [Candidatus Parcubacteria bacterium]|jgi:hypothetical protein|nr:hypothetical protein [Candidatus Parcubacteria bacterium]
MKKTSIIVIIVVILVIVGIIWFGRAPSGTDNNPTPGNPAGTTATSPTLAIPVTETTKVSGKLTQFQNAELGFAVNYPTAWEADSLDNGVTFIMPIDQTQVSTIAKLEANINAVSGKCAFPPVTTIKDRGTLTVGTSTLSMISMSNTVQGRNYFDRMYSLQTGGICYLFSFSSIALSPESKKLTGSNLTQAQNNNKAIVNTSDSDFMAMVKSFSFVTGPQGVDETKAAPTNK